MASLSAGQRLDDYEIIGLLGQGGMASVYRARQVNSQSEVAIKIIRPEDSERGDFIKRFEREARIVTTLNHRHIVKVYHHAQHEGGVYLAMELLSGGSLAYQIGQGPLTPAQIERLLSQIASALTYAHERGFVHRDLKPHNILFNTAGEAILTDFGIAKVMHETTSLTRTGMIIGTPGYMPPEQWRSELVDARTDVYALGVILFEMLTGQLPFKADTPMQMMHQHIYQAPPSVHRWRPDAPWQIDAIIEKALEKHPERRFQSAEELAMTFRAVLKSEHAWGIITPEAVVESRPLETDPTQVADTQPSTATDLSDRPTLAPVSPTQAAEQERHALALLAAERKARPSKTGKRFINPLPQEVGDKFKGRIKEQSDLVRLLEDKAHLISIYGRGGVGKTALVCKVLGDLQARTSALAPDGMVYLNAISTGINLDRIFLDFGKLLPDEAKTALEAARSDPQMPTVQKVLALLKALSGKRYILLLDNLETLQNPETGDLTDPEIKTFIEVILEQDGPLSVIVTSREPLPLPHQLKSQERLIPLDTGLPLEDAIALLRASDPDGVAGLRDAPDRKLVKIAEKMRGFPRALEAVVGLLLTDNRINLDDMLDETHEGKLLDSEITPLIVQQAIERLSPAAIRVLEALAVFALPISPAAVEFLLAPYVDTSTLPDLLNRLARSYFVNLNKAVQKFGLHPIDRDYCYMRLPDGTPEDKPTSDVPPRYTRHALNYRAADFYQRQRQPQEAWKSIDDVEPQLVEFEHLVRAEGFNEAAQLLMTIGSYLIGWGYSRRVVALHEPLQGHITDDALVGKSVGSLGTAYYYTGQPQKAVNCYEQALVIARAIDDRREEIRWLGNLGIAFQELGQMERAIELYQQAFTIAHEIGNRRVEAINLGSLGIAYFYLGQVEQAIEFCQQALVIAREIGNRRDEGIGLGNLGEFYYRLGQVEQAIEFCQQALVVAREIGDREGEANRLSNLGSAQAALGLYADAIQNLSSALALYDEFYYPQGKSGCGRYLALTLLLTGDLAGARQAISAAQKLNVSENNYSVLALQGVILMRLDDHKTARSAFDDAVRYANDLLSKTPKYYEALYTRALARAGLVLVARDDSRSAIHDYHTARSICAAAGVVAEQLRILEALMACPGGEVLESVRQALAGQG